MAQTISKHIGEGFGKGEVAAALAYDPADTFGGMKIKSIMHNEDEKAYFRDSGAYIYASASGVLEITATTINLNGAFAFTGTDKLALGTNAAKLTLTEGLPVLQVYTTCASTDGATTANPVYISATMSGTGGVGRALEAMLTVSGKLGTYGNALKGYTVLTGGTGSTGLISAVCAEMLMSGGATLGTFGVLELELVCPASWTAGQGTNGANCISLIYAQASNASGSTTLTEFDTYGYLLNLQGLTDDTGHLYYDDTLRIVIGSTVKYIPLSSATASFTTAYPIVTSIASGAAIDITGPATGIDIGTNTAVGINMTGGGILGIDFNGTWTGNVIQVGDASAALSSGTDGIRGIYINYEYTKIDGGSLKGVRSEVYFNPATTGYGSVCALDGWAGIKATKVWSGSVASNIAGVQGVLNLQNTAEINCTSATIFSAVCGTVIGSATFTAGGNTVIAAGFFQNQNTTDMSAAYVHCLVGMCNNSLTTPLKIGRAHV